MAYVLARIVDTDRVEQAYRHQVAGLHHRFAQAHRAGEVAGVVLRAPQVAAPVLEDDGCVEYDRRGIEAALEGRCVYERLETGAGLAARLRGAIEFVAREAVAARQRAQCAIARLKRYQGRLRTRQLVERVADGGWAGGLACSARRSIGRGGGRFAAKHPDEIAALHERGGCLAIPALVGAQLDLAAVGEHHPRAAVGDVEYQRRQQVRLGGDVPKAGEHRGFILAVGQVEVLLDTVPAVAQVVGTQASADRPVGGGLQDRVDGGDDVVALGQRLGAVPGDHFLPHHFGHVRRIDLDRAFVRRRMHRHRHGGVCFGLADVLQLRHPLQDVYVAAFLGAGRVAERVRGGRELGDGRKRCHFVQRKLVQLLAVIELGCRSHAVGAVAEEALVEIQLENLVLAQLVLDAHCQHHLGELALVAVLLAQEELACDLLGDGGAARHALVVGGRQQPHRAGDALVVDAMMLIEAGILGGQEGLLEVVGHFFDVDRIAPGLAEEGHQPAVARVDVHRLLQLDRTQGFHVRQLGSDKEVQDAQRGGAKQDHAGGRDQRPAQQAT